MTSVAMLPGVMLSLVISLAAPPQAAPPPPEAAAAMRDRVLEQAAAELQAGRRAEAKKLLASAAERFTSVRAMLQLARLQSGEGDAAGALATLDRARTLAPDTEEVLSAIAQVALAARRPVQALLALEPLTRLAPRIARHHYLFGVALMQAGDMPAATEALQAADRLEPGHNLTSIALGIALNSRKMFGDAKPLLLHVLEREPDNVEALAALAEAEEGLGELDAADSHAARALAATPSHPTANLVVGMVLMKRDRYQEARDALERAAAADTESPKVYYQLSLACARLGDSAGASRNRELYQQKLRAMEARIEELRRVGLPSRGEMPR
ncbi:MAG TPA: tetratricopeptide repeat protein [Vicinamibacterales bacterium]|nr:tetratricopeptide repeat protein [Vicinamibacterales bacterium]